MSHRLPAHPLSGGSKRSCSVLITEPQWYDKLQHFASYTRRICSLVSVYIHGRSAGAKQQHIDVRLVPMARDLDRNPVSIDGISVVSLIHHVSVRWRAPWRRTLIKRKRAHFQNEFSHIRGRPPCFTPKWKMYSGQWTIHCLNPHQPCAMSPGLQSERNLSITPKWCRGSLRI